MNKKKIHLKLKKNKNKIQQCYKNFDQHHHNNFQLQNQNKKWQDFQQELYESWQFFRQDCSRLKNHFFIKKCDYCKKNHLYFKCNYSNHSAKNCKFSFNSKQAFVKNDKIKSQFYKIWARKHIKIQILHASNFNNNNKNDHDVYIIINEDYESDSDKSCKCSKN